jgi:uncharacterized protein
MADGSIDGSVWMTKNAAYWIKKLHLSPHPEGGYYRQTYRSDLLLPQKALPQDFSGPRPASTAIYFLLNESNFSAFHRLRSDELWHFYLGAPLLVHVIEANGGYSLIRLGGDPECGEVFQAVVKAGFWFASEVAPPEKGEEKEKSSRAASDQEQRFSLVGCTVAPGFDFADFELAERNRLMAHFPQHRSLIARLTRA